MKGNLGNKKYCPLQLASFAQLCYVKLDVAAMREACRLFQGTHNLLNFCKKDPKYPEEEYYVKSIDKVRLVHREDQQAIQYIQIQVTAKAFFRYQIRFMVGVIIKVGQGMMTTDKVQKLLSREIIDLPMKHKALPQGLFLSDLKYSMLEENDDYKDSYEFNR